MTSCIVIGALLGVMPASSETLQSLQALGYVDSAPADNPDQVGVTRYEDDASPGLNLLTSRNAASAQLVDMNGVVQHSWEEPGGEPWMHVELLADGELLALAKDRYLVKLDRHSRTIWRVEHRVHHDFSVLADGRILVLARRYSEKVLRDKRVPVLEDILLWIGSDGRIQKTRSVFELVRKLIPEERIRRLERAVESGASKPRLANPEYLGDLTHTNSIEVLHRDLPGIAPAGSLLLSFRELNRIGIADRSLKRLVWVWGKDELQAQHHATQLRRGRLMVFDNGVERNQSRVVEVNVKTRKIVWSYTTPEFFTRLRGAAQKLPNGNVLITESDSGHVIEVTRSGDVVWEYWNPFLKQIGDQIERDAIYRLVRYPTEYSARSYLTAPR